MTGSEARRAVIVDMLRKRDYLSVDELAAHFSVATQTIRRDLAGLCDLGLARRRHGGIERMSQGRNLKLTDRRVLNREAKQRIALAVAQHVGDGESVALGIGTTPQFVAEGLLTHRDLKIVTNNLPLALMIGQNSDFALALAGGAVRLGDLDVCGQAAVSFFASFKVDVAIFGVAGVDEDGALLDFSEDEVRVRQAMLRHCRRSYLVLDTSKFGRPAYVHGGHITDVSAVFCEAEPPARIRKLVQAAEVDLFCS